MLKINQILMMLIITASCFSQTPEVPTNGDGSSENPYKIANINNLYWLSQSNNEWDKYYIQTQDINASSTLNWDNGKGFYPIGDGSVSFTGNYNGNGYVIDSLYINRSPSDYYSISIGFFGEVENGARIKNLGITNLNFNGDVVYAGGLVGVINSYSYITNCYVTGEINCTSDAIGGLVGFNYYSRIYNSYSLVKIIGNNCSSIGGFVGLNWNSYIYNSFCTGDVIRFNGNTTDIGAFCGYNKYATIYYCYTIGNVTFENATDPTNKGFIGYDNGSGNFNYNFFDKQVSNQNSALGAIGKNTSEMKDRATFINANWNFSTIWDINDDINAGYPYNYFPFSGGEGTDLKPYIINTFPELKAISENTGYWDDNFIQGNNINASSTSNDNGKGLLPIGNNFISFSGSYNGNRYIIDSLYINRPETDYIGLFGYVNASKLSNIIINNENIIGDSLVGGLVGLCNNSSSIENCSTTGFISGDKAVGGLSGYNKNSSIKRSYSISEINGKNYLGGLAGKISDTAIIRNSYSKGNITRANGTSIEIGSFCGFNNSSTIEYCYSTGEVIYEDTISPINKGFVGLEDGNGSYSNNFFDKNTTAQSSAIGATGKTTIEMNDISTFISGNWDFVEETINGTDDIWNITITANNGYPHLNWQLIEPNGDGSIDEPYEISDLNDLLWLSRNKDKWSSNYIQTNNIDASGTVGWNNGKGFSPIGNNIKKFTGYYNGKDYVISELFINRSNNNYIGLFGYTDSAKIINLGLLNVDIKGNSFVGSIAGFNFNNSSVNNCFCSGSINGASRVGGIVGYNNSSDVNNSFNESNINATGHEVGGIVGRNDNSSKVKYCYSSGEIGSYGNYVGGVVGLNSNSSIIKDGYSISNVIRLDGNYSYFGGFCGGNNNSTIANCYSIGNVIYNNFTNPEDKGFIGIDINDNGIFNNNFFDSQASNQSYSSGATAKNTNEMKNIATFTDIATNGLNSPWDFINNPNDDNSTGDYWGIISDINDNYPYFAWQTPPIVVCKDSTFYLNEDGFVQVEPFMIDEGSTDDYGIDTMFLSKYVFNCTNIGENIIKLFVEDISGNKDSCSALITILDTISTPDTTLFIEICNGDSIEAGGAIQYISGAYYDTLFNTIGCDSIIATELIVHDLHFFTEQTEICQGESFNWRGADYSSAGTFYDSLLTVNGCDSVYQLELTVNQTYEFTEQAEICDGETYTWRSDDYTESGIYYDSLLTTSGCDSVYKLDLNVFNLPVVNLGDDQTITTQDSLTLDAGEFESYLWQDNSTQRTYTVIGSDYEPGSHMFWVEVTDSNTCKASDTISVTIEEISGIVSSYRNEGMLLYPNPANDKINVEFTQPAGEKIIFEIISIEGQLLLSKTFRNIAKNSKEYIDLNGLSPGVYMVKINVGNHTKTQKLIIK